MQTYQKVLNEPHASCSKINNSLAAQLITAIDTANWSSAIFKPQEVAILRKMCDKRALHCCTAETS